MNTPSAMKSRLAGNAALNVLAGASGALFAFLVPALLATRISAIDLSIWAVVLQSAIYVAPFALGIQSVLARRVALHAERSAGTDMRHTMSAAFRILLLASLVYLLLGGLVSLYLGRLYPDIPADRLLETQWTFFIFLAGQSSLIPTAAIAGYFFGLQRNLSVTANALGSRILASVAIVGLAGKVSLIGLAAAASAIFLAGNLGLYAAYCVSIRRRAGSSSLAALPIAPAQPAAAMLRECAPISLWTLAHFLIYGGTTTIASATDFENFPAYSMAAAASLVLLGFHSAAMHPLIPHVAVVQERGGPVAVANTLQRASLISVAILAVVLLLAALFGQQLINRYFPADLAASMLVIVPILLFGNVVRLLGLPYSSVLVGLGMQGRILWTPVLEAATAFGFALLLAPSHGLPGVAAGIAIGGVVSITMHFLINMPRTRAAVPVDRLRTLAQAALMLLPAAVAMCLMWTSPLSNL